MRTTGPPSTRYSAPPRRTTEPGRGRAVTVPEPLSSGSGEVSPGEELLDGESSGGESSGGDSPDGPSSDEGSSGGVSCGAVSVPGETSSCAKNAAGTAAT